MKNQNPETIALSGPAVFISDLHLSDRDPQGMEWFCHYLEKLTPQHCQHLFILGDLFDYWVGPKQMHLPGFALVIRALAKLQDKNIRATIIPGNRDGYLEQRFAAATGVHVGGDYCILQMNHARAILTHGDLLCTRDHKYQRLRKILRSRFIRWLAPRLPLWMSMAVAGRLRRYSQRVVPSKLPEEKGLVIDAVIHALQRFRGDLLICGHVHEKRQEALSVNGRQVRLIVLPAFAHNESELAGNSADVLKFS